MIIEASVEKKDKWLSLPERIEHAIQGRDLEVEWIDSKKYLQDFLHVVHALAVSTIDTSKEGKDPIFSEVEFIQFANDAITFTSELFANCIDNERLLYHGIKHVMDVALNALAILYLYKQSQTFADIEISIDDIKLLFIAALLHEVDDWWFPQPIKKDKDGNPVKQRTSIIQKFLGKHSIQVSEDEIPYTEVKTKREELLTATTDQEQKARFLSMVLHTADFAQVVNPAYHGEVSITGAPLPALIAHAIESFTIRTPRPADKSPRTNLRNLRWLNDHPSGTKEMNQRLRIIKNQFNRQRPPFMTIPNWIRLLTLVNLENLNISQYFWQKFAKQWLEPLARAQIDNISSGYANTLLERITQSYKELGLAFDNYAIFYDRNKGEYMLTFKTKSDEYISVPIKEIILRSATNQ